MIRLGRISYVNMAPVFFRLDAEVDEVQGVPTELNGRLLGRRARRRADLVDRVRAARGPAADPAAALRLLRGRGRLDPARVEAAARAGADVAVTPETATSVVLTKVLLPDATHVPLGEEADAKLLIGDAALKSRSRIRRRTTTSAASGSSAPGCRWSSPCGRRRSRSPRASPSWRTHWSRRSGRARRAGAARVRGERALRLSRRLPRALLREAALLVRPARARGPADVPRARARRGRARPCPGASLRGARRSNRLTGRRCA